MSDVSAKQCIPDSSDFPLLQVQRSKSFNHTEIERLLDSDPSNVIGDFTKVSLSATATSGASFQFQGRFGYVDFDFYLFFIFLLINLFFFYVCSLLLCPQWLENTKT